MNQYDQLSLLYEAAGTFKKAATVTSKLISNDSDYFNANQTGSFAFSLKQNTTNFEPLLKNDNCEDESCSCSVLDAVLVNKLKDGCKPTKG